MEACPENCYAKVVEAVSKTQNEQMHAKLDVIIGNQSALIQGVNKVVTVIADLNNLNGNFADFREQARKEHDEIFTRLRQVEAEKISKRDVIILLSVFGVIIAGIQVLIAGLR